MEFIEEIFPDVSDIDFRIFDSGFCVALRGALEYGFVVVGRGVARGLYPLVEYCYPVGFFAKRRFDLVRWRG